MRTNVKSSSMSDSPSLSSARSVPESASELVQPSPPPEGQHRPAGSWAEDWSDSPTRREMSAMWPLLWLTVPLVLLVLYGLLAGH